MKMRRVGVCMYIKDSIQFNLSDDLAIFEEGKYIYYNYTQQLYTITTFYNYILQPYPTTIYYNYTQQLYTTTIPNNYILQTYPTNKYYKQTQQLYTITTFYNYILQLYAITIYYNYKSGFNKRWQTSCQWLCDDK